MITSTANSLVKQIRALQTMRKARTSEGLFVLEGRRLMQEIVITQTPVKYALHVEALSRDERSVLNSLARLGADVQLVSDNVMTACSSAESPSHMLAVVPQLEVPLFTPKTSALVVDRLSDPGNFGTILRTALAAGIEAVLYTKGTVDTYNPKVVRGAMGAQLRLPIFSITATEIRERLAHLQLWAAASRQGLPYYEVDWREPFALVIGSESHGIDPAIQSICNGQTCIPMPGDIDSLNAGVATAIFLFETVRQRGGL